MRTRSPNLRSGGAAHPAPVTDEPEADGTGAASFREEARRLPSTDLVAKAAVAFGLALVANGLWMLLSPSTWYWYLPADVPSTGPLNQHFVRDIGLMYAASGAAFVAMAWPRLGQFVVGVDLHRGHDAAAVSSGNSSTVSRAARDVTVLWAATAWHVLHAGLHLWEVAAGIMPWQRLLVDAPVFATAAAAIGIARCWG